MWHQYGESMIKEMFWYIEMCDSILIINDIIAILQRKGVDKSNKELLQQKDIFSGSIQLWKHSSNNWMS